MSNGNGEVRDYKADAERLRRIVDVQEKGINEVNAANQKLQSDLQLQLNISLSLENQMLQLKLINQNIMTENNKVRQENAEEISRLRQMVKDLGGNPNT